MGIGHTQWKCFCLSCRREFGRKEKQYDYSYPFGSYERYKQKQKQKTQVSDTYLEGSPKYCIVPWLNKPQIIPDRKFHEWYEDMKQFSKNYVTIRKERRKRGDKSSLVTPDDSFPNAHETQPTKNILHGRLHNSYNTFDVDTVSF